MSRGNLRWAKSVVRRYFVVFKSMATKRSTFLRICRLQVSDPVGRGRIDKCIASTSIWLRRWLGWVAEYPVLTSACEVLRQYHTDGQD